MVKFEKLSTEEVEKLKKRRTPTLELSSYLSYLDTLKSGDWGALTVEEGDSTRAIKRRLTLASKQQGKTIKYKKTEDTNKIVFEVK